ncbi:GNAT family N-acetyltransferase, partial [Pseudomonas syringae]
LVRHLIEHFMSRGLSYLDLSVLHDNDQAKALYAKLNFRNLPTFAIKRKNGINESLFLGPGPQADFNPYARIIVEEAHRRGIDVQVDDADAGLFTLSYGGRRIRRRGALSEFSRAGSMNPCQEKRQNTRAPEAPAPRFSQKEKAGHADDNLAVFSAQGPNWVKPLGG